jgi:hypothetical protein
VPAAFDSNRSWDFALGAEELWERITAVQDYRRWWPWLRRFEPGPGLVQGARWACEVVPPLPYVVRFTLRVDEVEPARSAVASVSGDIRGSARLTVEELDDGRTRACLVSRLAPAHPLLRGFGRVARPLVERGHDWVLDQGQRQFIDRALDDRPLDERP